VLQGGPDQLVVHAPDGASMRIPRAWTDADGTPEQLGNATIFSVESLRALLCLVEALQRRARSVAPDPPNGPEVKEVGSRRRDKSTGRRSPLPRT
jgi:hypothetical protein